MSVSGTVCQAADPSTCTDYCCSTTSRSSAPSWTPKRSHPTPTPLTGCVFLFVHSRSLSLVSLNCCVCLYLFHRWAVCFPATAFLKSPRSCGTFTSSRLTPSSSSSSCSSSSSMPSRQPISEALQKHGHADLKSKFDLSLFAFRESILTQEGDSKEDIISKFGVLLFYSCGFV